MNPSIPIFKDRLVKRMDLVKGLFEGSRLALARSITAVENEYENAIDMKAIYLKQECTYSRYYWGPWCW